MLGLFVKGKYAYAVYSGKELRIIDISNPASPSLTGTYKSSGEWQKVSRSIYVSSKYAYVADDKGFEIINIANPCAPSLVEYCTAYGAPEDIYVKGKYAYLTILDDGLKIIDISTPSSPTMAGSIDLPKGCNAVFISGKYAYVASSVPGKFSTPSTTAGKLYIINVVNPASPTMVGSIDLPEALSDVYVSGVYAYVTCGNDFYKIPRFNGLRVIDISKSASPSLVASYDASGWATKVDVKDNYIYLANGASGKLLVLRSEFLPEPSYIHVNRPLSVDSTMDTDNGFFSQGFPWL